MNPVCRLHVVEADQIPNLIQSPALELGQSALAGRAICHLPKSWESLRLLLSQSEGSEGEDFEDAFERGRLLSESDSARLFLPRDVERLHRLLSSWNPARLYQSFRQRLLATLTVGARCHDDEVFFDETKWEHEADSDDWTIEEAEEFESLVDAFDSLRHFLANAALAGQAIVWVAPLTGG